VALHDYLLFVGASIVLCIVPGPDMIYLLARCVSQGRKAGVMAALGFNVGGYVHLAAAILGLSAILATSATAFVVVKWIGAAYLVHLGVRALRGSSALVSLDDTADDRRRSARTIFLQAFLSDVLNPKVAVFFLALLPQFVKTRGASPTAQLVTLGVTVNVIAICVNLLIVLLATRITVSLRRSAIVRARLNRAMGLVLVALGLRLAAEAK
jgi:threonine/homoserine/homoserine lactone efflux protein